MHKTRLVLMFVLATMLVSAGPSAMLASEPLPQNVEPLSVPGLDSPVSEWTDADLKQLIDLALDEQITVPQAQAAWELLSEKQREKVGELLAVAVGIPLDEWQQFVKSENPSLQRSAQPEFLGEIWRQFIENVWTWDRPPGAVFANSYWTSSLCDDDPSDDDWVFLFSKSYEWYSRNPDGLRWTTTSVQVYLAFMAAYGGNLNGYAFNWREARRCLGTTGVSAAGGPNNVKNTTYLHPNN